MSGKTVSLRQRAASGGKWTAASAIACVSLQLVQLATMGRLLKPADFGMMAMLMLLIGLANALADFGVGNFLVQIETLSRQLLHKLLTLGLLLSAFLALLLAISSELVASYYQTPALTALLPWLSLLVVSNTFGQFYFSLLQRFFQFKVISLVEIISTGVGFLATLGMALSDKGVWSLIVGQILMSTSKIILYYPSVHRIKHGLPENCSNRLSKALKFGAYQMGERLLNFFAWNLDKLIIGKLLGDSMLGVYSVAYQLMLRPFSVLNPIFTRVSLPIFSSIRNDDEYLASAYLKMVRIIALLSFPVYLFLCMASPAVIALLLGQQWRDAAVVFSILCVLGMFFSIGNPIGTLILAKGKPAWAFYFNLFSLFVYAIAFWIGCLFGISGVAWAFLASSVLFIYPLEFYLRYRLVGMSVRNYFIALRHIFLATIFPSLLFVLLKSFAVFPETYPLQIIFALSGGALFMSHLWFFENDLMKSTFWLIFSGK